jgi:hypothetical protein
MPGLHEVRDFGPRGRAQLDQVLPSVAAALGASGFSNSLALPEANRYVVMVLDGLGLELLQANADAAPFLSSLSGVDDVVCGVPSTTATSLTSLGVGAQVGVHGVPGYTCRVPGLGRRMNMLVWDQPVDPEEWQPHRTMFERTAAAGIPTSVVNDAKFEQTGLTLCSQRGVPFHGVRSTWERLDVVVEVIESGPRGLVYTYENSLDHTGHAHGCTSAEWRLQLTAVDAEVRRIRDELPDGTVLLVTADHGMIDLPESGRFDLDAIEELREGVELVAGEARFRHLYAAPGAAADVAGRWREEVGDRAVVALREDAVEWFGPIAPEVQGRLGDVVVAALGDFAVFSSKDFPQELALRGFHGSVTEAELRIPLLVAPGS